MKKWCFLILIIGVIFLTGCSSKPDIDGIWKVDNWKGEYIQILPNRDYYRYMKSENIEKRDFFEEGVCLLTKQDNRDCLMLQSNPESDMKSTYEWYAVEIISNDQIVLYTDKDFQNKECLDLTGKDNLEQINLKRFK